MTEVPLISVRCGEWRKKQPGCLFLSITNSSPWLDFIYRDDDGNVRFRCRDISAVDLRVQAKFGAIDALKGTLTVECLSPVCVDIGEVSDGGQSFIIKATFNVNETGAVRDIIRQLRKACSSLSSAKEASSSQGVLNTSRREGNINNEDVKLLPEQAIKTTSFKEGLPDWVSYIPYSLYSKRTRQSIELAIFIYMIFSVTWALWQLHNHVDFVRESLRPLIDMVKYQYHLLDSMVQVLNTVFEEYTTHWLCLVKPVYTVVTTMVSPLLKLLEQLSPLFQTILQALTTAWYLFLPVLKPVVSIGYCFLKYIYVILTCLKTFAARMWVTFCNVTLPLVVTTNLHSAKRVILGVYRGVSQVRHLDPLKAQFTVMRTTVISSCKALSLAIVHLARQVYKFIWLKRSAKAVKKE